MPDTPTFDPTQPYEPVATEAPVAPSSSAPTFDPSQPYTAYHGDTTASMQNNPGGVGEWLGGLGRPAAGQDQTTIGRGLSTIGSAIHGAIEPFRGAVQLVNKLDPTTLNNPFNAGSVTSSEDEMNKEDPESAANKAAQVDRAKSMEAYQQDYNLSRPGEIDKNGNNTSPDIASDITQGAVTAGLTPEIKAVGYFPELAKAIGTSILAGLVTPTQDSHGDQSKGDFLEDKAKQAGIAALTGAVAKHAGDIISPSVNAQTRMLLDSKITPTAGQLMRQSENPIIESMGKTEALSSGLPLVGSSIQKAQDQAVLDLNKAVANHSLKTANLTPLSKDLKNGSDIADELHSKLSDAYDSVVPKMIFKDNSIAGVPAVPPTPAIPAKRASKNFPNGQPSVPATAGSPAVLPVPDPWIQSLAILYHTAGSLGETGEKQFGNIVQNSVTSKLRPDGSMTGETLKNTLSDLRSKYKAFQGSSDVNQRMLGDHVEALYDAIKQNMVTNSAPADVAALKALDEGYSHYAGIVRPAAAKASANQGTYTPAQMAMVSRMADKSVGKGATARGAALEQPLAQAANAVLTKLADSQTTNRYANGKLLLGLLGAGAAGASHEILPALGAAAGITGTAALAYSKPGQNAAKWLLTGRQGPVAKGVSDAVTNYGGSIATPVIEDVSGNTDRSTPSTDEQMQSLLQQGHRDGGLIQHFADGGSVQEDPTYARNKSYVRPDTKSFQTDLGKNEAGFQTWVLQNKIPFDPSDSKSDYDMRGYYKALLDGDTAAHQSLNDNDGRMHFPDTYKTPYHQSFSNESQYATPDAPHWANDSQLMDKSGNVVFDEKQGAK